MHKIRVIFFIFLSTSIGKGVYAQFSVNDFLSGAKDDITLYQNKSKSEFINKRDFRSPLIHRVEFRFRTNDTNISVDDYRLRFSPTNPWEIVANKDFYKMQVDYLSTEYLYFLNEALYDRYNILLEYLKYVDYQMILQKEIQIKSDQYKIWQYQINNPDFDIAEYIGLKDDIFNNNYESKQLNYQIDRISIKIKGAYNFDGKIKDFTDPIISIEKVRQLISTTYTDTDVKSSVMFQKEEKENQLSEQELKIKKAEGKRNIGYLQAEYDRFRGNEFENHLGFQIGVRLPLTNPERPDLSRRTLNIMDDDANLKEEVQFMELQQDLILIDLNYLLDQYDLITEELNENTIRKLLFLYPDMKASDHLKAQSALTKLYKLEHEIKWKIYKSYIEYLYMSGSLVEYPLKNLLSEDLRVLD